MWAINIMLLYNLVTVHVGPPISLNPMISKNITHLTLLWSPPFLWPGNRTQRYNIHVSLDKTISHYYSVYASHMNPVVSHSISFNSLLLPTLCMLSCIEADISISPADLSALQMSQTFFVNDSIWIFKSGKHSFEAEISPLKFIRSMFTTQDQSSLHQLSMLVFTLKAVENLL